MACRLNVMVPSKEVFKIFFPHFSFITPNHSTPGEPDRKQNQVLEHMVKQGLVFLAMKT